MESCVCEGDGCCAYLNLKLEVARAVKRVSKSIFKYYFKVFSSFKSARCRIFTTVFLGFVPSSRLIRNAFSSALS